MCQFFDKRGYPVSVVQAGRQSALQTAEKETLTAFHSFSHFILTTTQLNLSFLKTFNYSKTIQRPVLSFRDLY